MHTDTRIRRRKRINVKNRFVNMYIGTVYDTYYRKILKVSFWIVGLRRYTTAANVSRQPPEPQIEKYSVSFLFKNIKFLPMSGFIVYTQLQTTCTHSIASTIRALPKIGAPILVARVIFSTLFAPQVSRKSS